MLARSFAADVDATARAAALAALTAAAATSAASAASAAALAALASTAAAAATARPSAAASAAVAARTECGGVERGIVGGAEHDEAQGVVDAAEDLTLVECGGHRLRLRLRLRRGALPGRSAAQHRFAQRPQRHAIVRVARFRLRRSEATVGSPRLVPS